MSPSAVPADVAARIDGIADRLHTAALAVSCLPADGPKAFFSTWPSYKHTWWDEGNETSKRTAADITRRLISPPRFYATAKQIDDCLPALALLDGVRPVQRRIISARAFQLWYDQPGGWRAIGADCGVSRESARKLHWAALVHAFEANERALAARLAA